MKLQNGGAEYIRAEIDRAVKNGTRRAIIKGDWFVEEAVRIPQTLSLYSTPAISCRLTAYLIICS
jgi:hypothetical protein